MKTWKSAEIKVPKLAFIDWLHDRFPELPEDVKIDGMFASSRGEEVKLTIKWGENDDEQEENDE